MIKKSLRTLTALQKEHLIKDKDLSALEKVADKFSVSISADMHDLIDKDNPLDPIALQFVPSVQELNEMTSERTDPIGDEKYKVVSGVIHRYPDRCLLMPVHICPVYCRFCFRREKIGAASETMTAAELEQAYAYISAHTEIWEVILTGGDPLILKPALLKKIINRLSAIPHVEIIRIHTRVPVVESRRINPEMIAALKCEKPVYVLLHANHPKEFTPEAAHACALLVDAGIPMLSQTVLLKNINDNIEVLSTLMRTFIKNRIKPYYLHHTDLAKGTAHFRTSIAVGQALMKQLRGRFSGLCQPTYVLDIPGGYGKVPVSHCYIHAEGVEDYQGNFHNY